MKLQREGKIVTLDHEAQIAAYRNAGFKEVEEVEAVEAEKPAKTKK
jgi:hypothetical protein